MGRKKNASLKILKLLRRQKIHTEVVFSLKEIKPFTQIAENTQPSNTYPVSRDIFMPFSDLYFKQNQILPSYLLCFKDYVQCDNSMLISKKNHNIIANFVPLIYKNQQFHATENLESKIISGPIFSNFPIIYYAPKVVCDYYSTRIPVRSKKPKIININLDEIVPMVEVVARNIEEHLDNNRINIEEIMERDVLLLNPLLLEVQPRRSKPRLTQSEHKKIIRITILYILGFFALALVTFFITYLA